MTTPITDPPCPFCNIASAYAPFPPTDPPAATSPLIAPTLTTPQSHIVLSTPHAVAFLDILPLAPAHLLICPRPHSARLSSVAPSDAAELGRYLPILSRAVLRVLGEGTDWNVVQNNGEGAGQVVGHVHFHVIPRVSGSASVGPLEGRFQKSFAMFGKGQREELDDEEGAEMATRLREAVAEVMRESEAKL